MKVNLNKKVKNLDDKEIEDSNLGKLLAQYLANLGQGNALKLMSWALKLHNGEELDLDPSDSNTFKDIINTYNFTTLLKFRILEELN